jgi:hypothetical protein
MKKTLALLTIVLVVIVIAVWALPKTRATVTAAQVALNAPQLLSTPRPASTLDPNLVYIRLYSPAGYKLDLNVKYILQIGDKKFERVCKDPTLLNKTADFCLTQSEFDGLTDGAPIAFRYDERSFVSVKCFGPFNKTQLQITEEYLRCLEDAIPYLTQAKSLLTDSNQIAQFDLAIEQMTGLLDARFWLDPIHLNPEQAEEFFAEARTALTTLSTLPDVPLSVDAGHDFGTVSANILSILYTMEGLAGVVIDEGLPPGASDFGDLDERAISILMKTFEAQKAQQNKDYLAAFDHYVSARQEALSNYVPDDAPKYPVPTTPLSLINADLLYYINSTSDEDSFIFNPSCYRGK